MSTVTTTSTLASINNYLERKSLMRPKDALVYQNLPGQKKVTIPQKNSATYKVTRYESLAPTGGTQAASLRSMVEGAVPTNVSPSRTDLSATATQYGGWVQWSDVAQWINEVDVNQNLLEVVSEWRDRVRDFVVRDNIQAGTNVFRLTDEVGGVSGANRAAVAGRINAAALDKAIRKMEQNNAERVAGPIAAGSGEGTSPVRAAYVMVIHPHVKYDLEQVPGYKAVVEYGSSSGLFPNEVGAYKDIRFILSTGAKIFADSGATKASTQSTTGTDSDVYACTLLGKEAIATIELADANEIIYKGPGQNGGDPLNQIQTLGFKTFQTALILNDNLILRFECVASA